MPISPPQQYSIIVIDDESANVEALSAILQGAGYTVFGAPSGEKGLEIIESEQVDLALLDILMPGLDGFETLSRIRVHKRTKDLPVIFLTGFMRDPQYMERGFNLGVNEYLLKPIETNELLVRVRSILRMTAAEKKVKQLQADFFSMLVHDLRGPLTAVRAFAQLLIEEHSVSDEDRVQMASMIESASVQMLTIINDILDLSKLESQYVALNKQPLNLQKTVEHSVQRMKPLAAKKSLHLTTVFEPGLVSISGDESKLEQVMDNLLMNAIKFTSDGGTITVSAGMSRGSGPAAGKVGVDLPSLVVCVKDTGVGIAAKDIPYMFDKYRQLVTRPTAGEKGTGLGLAICKNIVEAHGGKIWIESAPNAGSSFFFSLPVT
ncbi:MAG TPA: hybrid sensor histidine kinase/response regulator [Bacteroidota bacterium]|nr:hybrid sensor histidine kinase/response regulator [Bacteroidota bacterium]